MKHFEKVSRQFNDYAFFKDDRQGILLSLACASFISIIGYHKYIFNGFYFFSSADDMLKQILPNIIEMHHQIYNDASFMWSFYQGMGAAIFTGNPNHHGDIFAWLLAFLPYSVIPEAIIYVHILKIMCAIILFYLYLTEFGFGISTKVISSICYGFSGVMLCRGAWFHYGTEVVMIALFLLGMECWYRNKNSYLIVVSLCLLLISRYVVYVYIYTIFAIGYITLRGVYDAPTNIRYICNKIVMFAPKYGIGVLLAAVFLIPGIFDYLGSARVNAGLDITASIVKAFNWENTQIIAINFIKYFQPNITGYLVTGRYNVLEDLCGYSSILMIFLSLNLLIFSNISKYKKIYFFSIFLIILFYSSNGWLRYCFNGFNAEYYKTSSIWVNVAMILMGAYALDKKFISRNKLFYVSISLLFFCVSCYVVSFSGWIIKDEIYIAIILCAIYSCIFIFGLKLKNIKLLLLLIVVVELCISTMYSSKQFGYIENFSKNYVWDSNSESYKNAFSKIENKDDFFRIAIIYKKDLARMDSAISEFYGFDRYNSINGKDTVKFSDVFQNHMGASNMNFILNLGSYRGIRNMLSARYIYDDRTQQLNENSDYVKFGYLYDTQITEDELLNYPVNVRDDIFSKAAIVNAYKEGVTNVKDILQYSTYYINCDIKDMNDVQYERNQNNEFLVVGDNPFITYEFSIQDKPNTIYSFFPDISLWRGSEKIQYLQYMIQYANYKQNFSWEHSLAPSIRQGETYPYLTDEITDQIKYLRVFIGKKGQRINVSHPKMVQCVATTKDTLKYPYKPYVPFDKNSVCETVSFSPTEIHLKANTNDPRILFLSIPYDRGWSIYDNGKEIEVMHVNIGFMGAYLEPGEHNLVVKYRTPGLYEGAAISGITAIALLIMWIRRRRSGVA